MNPDGKSILKVLWRSLRLLCPACGHQRIARRPFRIRHHCPNCRAVFKREEGFFVGAILANLLTTELIILLVCVIGLTVMEVKYEPVLASLFVVALIFPVIFYHHSWSLWLGFDYLIEGLPKYDNTSSR
ncbi:MAG TPA: zinc ribbon domain-containing protein [Pyrinomonadaceae bacterium]|nr:zinc ribbon domain-containing protein [Pyrinomonadaceae bacterium]